MAKASKANGSHGFPRDLTLPNGTAIKLRLLESGDKEKILAFARSLPHDDLLFLRMDITEQATVDDWIRNVEHGDTATVIAEAGGEIVGYASVHSDQARWTRRVGEIRIITSSRYRGAGLGRRLSAEVFDLARSLGLKKITAQMTTDQTAARAAFEHLGFQVEAILSDWVEDRRGRARDLLIMTYDVAGFSDRIVA